MTTLNPLLNPAEKTHTSAAYSEAELSLANRNCGTLLETLKHDVTPLGAHYLLNHFDVPHVADSDDWTLALSGRFKNPTVLNLTALQAMPAVTKKVTLECAGNGRRYVDPRWPSQPWGTEAVGTAEWTGTSLRHVLQHAGIASQSKEIIFHGADHGIDGGHVHHFARSLSVDYVLNHDAIIAWQMNGQPLAPQHGFPLRLIVPGWYGMASVKWLREIEATPDAFKGHQQTGTYVYRKKPDDTGIPVTEIRVKSLLIPPGIPDWATRKRLIKPGPVTIIGRAWSGAGTPISKIEFGVNGHWQEAELMPNQNAYEWTLWQYEWDANQGQHELSCRATDANGNTQPDTAQWDIAGFGNNAIQKVEVWCDNY